MSVYRYKGWTISNKGGFFTACKGTFFTGYHACDTTGEFLDILERNYAGI